MTETQKLASSSMKVEDKLSFERVHLFVLREMVAHSGRVVFLLERMEERQQRISSAFITAKPLQTAKG